MSRELPSYRSSSVACPMCDPNPKLSETRGLTITKGIIDPLSDWIVLRNACVRVFLRCCVGAITIRRTPPHPSDRSTYVIRIHPDDGPLPALCIQRRRSANTPRMAAKSYHASPRRLVKTLPGVKAFCNSELIRRCIMSLVGEGGPVIFGFRAGPRRGGATHNLCPSSRRHKRCDLDRT